MTTVSFPGLGIGPFSMSKIALKIGDLKIAWYGLIIVTGIILTALYVLWRAKKQKISSDTIMDLALVLVLSGVVGARLYYVLTSLDKYDSILEVFEIWKGGLGIYGALIAGAIALVVMCRIKKLNFFQMADIILPAVFIGQALGRWGNFVNGEAFGSVTDLPWRMGLHYGSTVIYVHPTFLYECLWTLSGFVLFHFLFRHRRYNGQIFLGSLAWYGFGRVPIELLRTDSLYICSYHAWFTKISVIVGAVCFLVGTGFLIYFALKKRHDADMLDVINK